MSTKQQNQNQTGKNDDEGCNGYKDKDNATQVSININRTALCNLLYSETGSVSKLEARFNGESEIYKEKRCVFLNTEKNYRRYRNFKITTGTELTQTNVSIKANVAQIKEWNKNLNATLIALSKQVKDLKAKFGDLKDAACKLESSYKDKCNIGQKKALTGKVPENCPEPAPPIDACKDAEKEIDALICRPKGLAQDIDSIFQASSDVIGIQIFSNIDSLDKLQTDLATKSTAFDKLISDAMKLRKTELDKMQEDLVNSVNIITEIAVNRNSERSKFEGYYDATKFLCCPSCSCVSSGDHDHPDKYNSDSGAVKERGHKDCFDDNCPPRLKDCEKAICEICDQVKTTFCCDADNQSDGKSSTPPHTTKELD